MKHKIYNRTRKLLYIRENYMLTGEKLGSPQLIEIMKPRELRHDSGIRSQGSYTYMYNVEWCIPRDFVNGWLEAFELCELKSTYCSAIADCYYYGNYPLQEKTFSYLLFRNADNVNNRRKKLKYLRKGTKVTVAGIIKLMNPKELRFEECIGDCAVYCVEHCISKDFVNGWITALGMTLDECLNNHNSCNRLIDNYFYGSWKIDS